MSRSRPGSAPAGLALLLGACLASGCATGTRYTRPADPVQTEYIKPESSLPAGTEPGAVQHISLGSGPPDQWWTLLRSRSEERRVGKECLE